jgi:hypothetical protein
VTLCSLVAGYERSEETQRPSPGSGTNCSIDGSGVKLQAARSQVPLLIRSLNCFIVPNPSGCTVTPAFTQPRPVTCASCEVRTGL